MSHDPLSDVLRHVSAHSVISGGLEAGGTWAIAFPAAGTINFFGIARGNCWLMFRDEAPRRIGAGDIVLRSAHHQLILASDPEAVPVDLHTVVADKVNGISQHGTGDDFFMVGGKVALDAASGKLLLDALPSLIHIPAGSPHTAGMQWLLNQMMREQATDLPGTDAAASQLAHLLFIQILRAHLEIAGASEAGWLRAASDKRLAPVLKLMHAEPGRAWTLAQLAAAAGMSRASFALHFKTAAGVAPLAYLTQWRMQLAERALRRERTPVSVLAQTLGYGSESAFSNAFKRVIGVAPARYRANQAYDV